MHYKKIHLLPSLVLLTVLCFFTAACSSSINQDAQVTLDFSSLLFNQTAQRSAEVQVPANLKIKVELKAGSKSYLQEITTGADFENTNSTSVTFTGLSVGVSAQVFVDAYEVLSDGQTKAYAKGQSDIFIIQSGLNDIPVTLEIQKNTETQEPQEQGDTTYSADGSLSIDICTLDIELNISVQGQGRVMELLAKDKDGNLVTQDITFEIQILYKGQDVKDIGLNYSLSSDNTIQLENQYDWPQAQYDLFVTVRQQLKTEYISNSKHFVLTMQTTGRYYI